MKNSIIKIVFLFLVIFANSAVFAKIELPKFFSDNMVLQRETDAAIWGKATPSKEVKIITSWDNKTYSVKADASGRWLVKVKTSQAGGPYSISISDGKELKLSNILIGEVWLCSGQSNMEMPLAGWGKINDYQAEIAAANHPQIRLLTVNTATSLTPLEDDVKSVRGGWQVCSPATIDNFSATAYFFGRTLNKSLNVPIGLINSSWGGTIIEAWISGESLDLVPDFTESLGKIRASAAETNTEAEFAKKLREWEQTISAADKGFSGNTALYAAANFDDSGWKTMDLPSYWEPKGLPMFDGIVWFRKTIDIPTEWKGKELELNLDVIDDDDITYFNGVKIGETKGYNVPRKYIVPAKSVKAGKAVITIRVSDPSGNGGLGGSPQSLKIAAKGVNQPISLAGAWKYFASVNLREQAPMPRSNSNEPNRVTVLYNAMINPLKNMAIKGAIWYQGESNADRAEQYKILMPLMISDWRKAFNNDFPFYLVQLANYMAQKPEPSESNWAQLRDAQLQTLNLKKTGMAVTIDIGDGKDIHPKNKQDVGYRLALSALANTYGQNIAYSGPLYKSYKIEDNKIRISFTNTDKGLKTKGGGALKGFAIAGPDKKFVWADAKIEGNEVVVSSPKIEFPIAVRYAWADNPECNLYNGADLPASPFKTDFKY